MPKKLRGCLIAIAIVIVGAIVTYNGARWSYYQGWWDKDNPIARYLWLCDAPPGFEQTLYPENVEILVPACKNLDELDHRTIYFTSDRQYLRVGQLERSGYWLEIATRQITTTRPANVQYIARRREVDGKWIDVWFNIDSHEAIMTYPGGVTLVTCGTNYDFWEGLFSEDGRRIARYDGIYDAASGERLLQYGIGAYAATGDSYHQSIHDFYPCVWLPDNQSVILIPPMLPWGPELLIWGDYGEYMAHSEYPVPQPVLEFTVPDAYR